MTLVRSSRTESALEKGIRADRRIAAIVLPELLVEVARPASSASRPDQEDDAYTPTGVVLVDSSASHAGRRPSSEKPATPILAAVNRAAHACGVRAGQTVIEASAFAAKLRVLSVDEVHVRRALEAVAEVACAFGATVHVEASSPKDGTIGDSVWVDVSGAAHLFGGEEALVAELGDRVAELGLTACVAIADGPRIADAIARYGRGERVSPKGNGRASMAKLPLRALRPMPSKPGAPLGALDDAIHVLFARLGVFSVEDLLALPHAELTARIRYQDVSQGTRADILSLGKGTDPMPLTPWRPPDVLSEDMSFDDPIELTEPLLFVLRRLTSRLAARLQGRGQATNLVELTLQYDAKIFAREIDPDRQPREVFSISLPAPLATELDLFRTLKSKIDNLHTGLRPVNPAEPERRHSRIHTAHLVSLAAPIVSLGITLSRIVDAPHVQLDLSRDEAVRPDALPALLAELSADIGDERVGVLAIVDSHRPEARSRLVSPADPRPRRVEIADAPRLEVEAREPTRLLPEPIPLGSISVGTTVFIGHSTFEIVRVAFDRRLDGIEWWARANAPLSRDYVNLWLARHAPPSPLDSAARHSLPSIRATSPARRAITEGWAYVDRATGEAFLHGLWE